MESSPYYCKSSKLCKQINHSNPERPKPLRFLHHLWGHQCTKESSEACPHERISSDTDTNTEEKKVLIWRVSLNQNLDQPSLVLLQQLFQQEWSLLSPAKGGKGKRKCKKVDNYFSFPCRRTIKHDTYNYRAQIFKQNRIKTTLISVTKI